MAHALYPKVGMDIVIFLKNEFVGIGQSINQ